MKIVYLGTPVFSIEPLRKLNNSRHKIELVVTQPPKKQGRKNILSYSPVYTFCKDNNIKVATPTKFKEVVPLIDEIDPDLVITCAYGKILPKSFVEKYYCINIHPSMLPLARGASPVQFSILNEYQMGISIFKMDAGMDTGDILVQEKFSKDITNDYIDDVFLNLSIQSASMLMLLLTGWKKKSTLRTKQETLEETPSYSKLITINDLYISPSDTALSVLLKIRAYGKVIFHINDNLILLYKAIIYDKIDNGNAGSIYFNKKGLFLRFNDFHLLLEKIQQEGKKVMDSRSFLNGQKSLQQNQFIKEFKNE
jgi:methionyl-tRNA formyltransferase